MKVPLQVAYKLLRSIEQQEKWMDPTYWIGYEMFVDQEHYREFRTKLKLPFPFANREAVMSQWDVYTDTKAIVVYEGILRR
jgi:hypothetical protein